MDTVVVGQNAKGQDIKKQTLIPIETAVAQWKQEHGEGTTGGDTTGGDDNSGSSSDQGNDGPPPEGGGFGG